MLDTACMQLSQAVCRSLQCSEEKFPSSFATTVPVRARSTHILADLGEQFLQGLKRFHCGLGDSSPSSSNASLPALPVCKSCSIRGICVSDATAFMPEGLRVQPAPALELGLGLPSLRLTLLCDQGFLVKILNRPRLPGSVRVSGTLLNQSFCLFKLFLLM
jgi:hypothetical protein